ERLVQPRLAAMLEAIARDGGRAFYEGENPRLIAAKVTGAGGWLESADFTQYRANVARPVCGAFAGLTILGVAAPMAAQTGIESLQLAELSAVQRLGDPTTDSAAATRLADAVRIGLADRRAARAGRDGLPASVRGVASREFAESRVPHVGRTVSDTLVPASAREFEGAALTPSCARHDPYPAVAVGSSPRDGARDATDEASFTSHLSVIDRDRNAVTMTSSIGVLWGSGVYANGMWLNSSANLFVSDERGPRRRPTSLTMPLLALDGDDVRLAIGAAGGGYIAAAVVQTTFRILALQQDPYLALAAPRFQVNPTSPRLEAEPGFAIPVYAGWRAHGYVPSSRVADLTFGAVHTVMQYRDGRLVGAADPRRDGAALGY
ncbi:MAG TPA: gamma-glutamyltransferase, partial [Gemmatimonadaceae bacterium]